MSTVDSKKHISSPILYGLATMACVAIVILGSYYIVMLNRPTSPIKSISKNEQNKLTNTRATGKIETITSRYIQVMLPNGVIRHADFDQSTKVSTPTGTERITDIQPGTSVILFTKMVSGQEVATRIIVQ